MTKVCLHCGAIFERPPDYSHKMWESRKVCSQSCSAARSVGRQVAPRRKIPIEIRFWKYVDKDGPIPSHKPELGPCWVWTGAKRDFGYGVLSNGSHSGAIRAHRLSWEIHNGAPPPPELHVCHHCDNPPCVNPTHLFIGADIDNSRDMWEKGREGHPVRKRGEEHPHAITTEAVVLQLRESYKEGASLAQLTAQFGLSRDHIGHIVKYDIWRHVK